ncbi:MAG TPA: DUF3306 domain-containing protein [Phenylobacterium sp.]|nr:DUF3306 domain-containing protein [Phenylobacterium sp.]
MSDDGFLSRWARRKAEVRAGRPVTEAPQPPDAAAPTQDEAARGPAGGATSGAGPAPTGLMPPASSAVMPGATGSGGAGVPPGVSVPSPGHPGVPPAAPSTPPADEPPPTLEEAARLAPGADVSRFVRRGVDASVQRTALKRLFADPHFNIMDGLDVYIDDYGKPDPIPEAMLRQMNQSRFLGLFEDTQTAQTGDPAIPTGAPERSDTAPGTSDTETAQNIHEAQDPARDIPQDLPAPSSPAHDAPAPDAVATHPAATQPTAHEDPDLQLQPDDPAGRTGPEERAGTGRA